ncbi:uncharacterized protein KY384_000108 [Bacidia gigantensis]|uniref:uncharacterized protein n=1 Tax=Bacidia gigantensis TaxID=2732470 RepID=UPI001D052B00|nr:uncharacterized protein KY384_000108 [Bacidia gigantensis]KAG8526115.1 hypothetical protein KY384_000108 [Bacidia gigantensis]
MVRPATSVLLQGVPQTATQTLFLFPDGAGSASAYIKLPKIRPDLAVVGLNCPFVRHPEEMTCTLDELVGSYLNEIRRRKPSGPYNFGGWSAGGSLAFKAASELISQGDEVSSLTLLDSPAPQKLGKLPQRFLDHLREAGVFQSGVPGGPTKEMPKTLMPHFNGTMEIMAGYRPKPLPEGKSPKTTIIYATDSALKGDKAFASQPGDPDDMKFLTENKTDLSATAWKELVPGVEVKVERAEGADHFSLMVCKSHEVGVWPLLIFT